jgi:catechol 2,3-dioxygenase-like lactoylglutathione lyase family enzyme
VAVTHTFAGLPVTDYTTAYEWYVRLLGREADVFPHGRECVWHLTQTSSIYVAQDPERAGRALVTLALDDLDDHERRLRQASFAFSDEASGSAPRRLIVNDPDGNRLSFFQDPSSPGGMSTRLGQCSGMTPEPGASETTGRTRVASGEDE